MTNLVLSAIINKPIAGPISINPWVFGGHGKVITFRTIRVTPSNIDGILHTIPNDLLVLRTRERKKRDTPINRSHETSSPMSTSRMDFLSSHSNSNWISTPDYTEIILKIIIYRMVDTWFKSTSVSGDSSIASLPLKRGICTCSLEQKKSRFALHYHPWEIRDLKNH